MSSLCCCEAMPKAWTKDETRAIMQLIFETYDLKKHGLG